MTRVQATPVPVPLWGHWEAGAQRVAAAQALQMTQVQAIPAREHLREAESGLAAPDACLVVLC